MSEAAQEVHLNEPQTLYRHWEESQWSPWDIDPAADHEQWRGTEDRWLVFFASGLGDSRRGADHDEVLRARDRRRRDNAHHVKRPAPPRPPWPGTVVRTRCSRNDPPPARVVLCLAAPVSVLSPTGTDTKMRLNHGLAKAGASRERRAASPSASGPSARPCLGSRAGQGCGRGRTRGRGRRLSALRDSLDLSGIDSRDTLDLRSRY